MCKRWGFAFSSKNVSVICEKKYMLVNFIYLIINNLFQKTSELQKVYIHNKYVICVGMNKIA